MELQDLDLDLLLKTFVEIIAWGRLPLCTQRWITVVLIANFRPVLHGNTNSLSLFWMSTSFDLNFFTWIPDGGIVLRSSGSTVDGSPVQLLTAFNAYPMNFPGKIFVPNWCTRPWSVDDIGSNFTSAPNRIICPSNDKLNRIPQGFFWPSASRSCTFQR